MKNSWENIRRNILYIGMIKSFALLKIALNIWKALYIQNSFRSFNVNVDFNLEKQIAIKKSKFRKYYQFSRFYKKKKKIPIKSRYLISIKSININVPFLLVSYYSKLNILLKNVHHCPQDIELNTRYYLYILFIFVK